MQSIVLFHSRFSIDKLFVRFNTYCFIEILDENMFFQNVHCWLSFLCTCQHCKSAPNYSNQTRTSSFHFTWKYTDVTNFGQIQHSTGSIIPLNLTQNTYYRFNSHKSQVVFHTGSIIGDNDQSRYRIYVYDGENLNAKFLGNLVVFTDNSLAFTGRSLTLVNYSATVME